MKHTASRGSAVATAVAVLAVVGATAAAVWAVDRQGRNDLASRLRSNLRAMVQTLDLWAADQVRGVKAVARRRACANRSRRSSPAGRPRSSPGSSSSSAVRGYAGYFVDRLGVAGGRLRLTRGCWAARRTSPPTGPSRLACGRRARPSPVRCPPRPRGSTPRVSCAPARQRSSSARGSAPPRARAARSASASTRSARSTS